MTADDASRNGGDGSGPDMPARLDHAVLAALRGMGRPGLPGCGALPRLIPLFLATASSQLAALHAALSSEDIPTLHATAHTMKSSCGSIGAARLAALCETLETRSDSRRGTPADAAGLRDLVLAIEHEFAAAADALRAVLAAPG